MADTVQESNFSFFPPPQDFVTAHHAFILLLFPARYTDLVHSIREKRPRVSAAPVSSLSLSLPFFTVAAGNRPVFAESGRDLFLSLDRIQTAHDPIDRDSESALRTGTDQIRRSQGRESDTLHRKGRERERESFNDRGPNRPCSPSVIFIAGQKMFSRTLWNEKSIRSFCNCSEIGRWNAEGYFWNNFVETFTGFYYVTCWWGTLIQKVSFILHDALIYIHFAHLGGKSEELFI